MLDIIQHNPYRIIGVYSTAKRNEIVVYLARIKANIRVNRQVSFPADLDGILPSPQRTYNIYFYGGKGWNPIMENGNVIGSFVYSGHIQKDGPVEFYNQYGEYTLYPVQNGNLQQQGALKGEAF